MIRLATYNIEWFASLFDADDDLMFSNKWSGRHDVTKGQQIAALGKVFRRLGADAIMIIEAPNTGQGQSTVRALENFARHFNLRQNKALIGFENETQQEIALLYDPKKLTARHDPVTNNAPAFDQSFEVDLGIDDTTDKVVFSKPPLEVLMTTRKGQDFRLIGVHAKSKAPHGARNEKEQTNSSIANRRKQLAQCKWLRARIEHHIDVGENLIVLGDFNDGPGLDQYEAVYGISSVEIVVGDKNQPDKQLSDPHANAALLPFLMPVSTTSRFYNHASKMYLNALLDYIMVSKPILDSFAPNWTIWHPFDNPKCFDNGKLRNALLTASDHFPVTVDLDVD